MPRPEPKYPWFTLAARDALYDAWLTHQGAVNFPRLVQAFAPCYRHAVHKTTDDECLGVVTWALQSLSEARFPVTPERVAQDWVFWLNTFRADPWTRWQRTEQRAATA